MEARCHLPGVGDELAEVFVRIGNEDVNNVALVRLRAELWQQLCEVRVAHTTDGFVGEVPGLIQILDDASLSVVDFSNSLALNPAGGFAPIMLRIP